MCLFWWLSNDVYFQVLVIIDAKPKDLGLPTEAYIAVEEVHDVSNKSVSPKYYFQLIDMSPP